MTRLLLAFARFLLRLFYKVEVRGEYRPGERTLIVANHESFLDPILLAAFVPKPPVFLVHTTIARQWYVRPALWLMRHEIVDTSQPLAMKRLVALVESGEPVVIFPEGRITITGSLMKIYDGPAFVAARTGCTVVPIHIDGAVYTVFSRMSGDVPRRLFTRIRLTFGEPAVIEMPDARRPRDRRRLASERLRRLMQQTAYEARRPKTLWQALVEASALHGRKRTMLEDINSNFRPVTFGTILKGSLALGRLVSRLTQPGETVAVLMPNANATVYLLFGVTAFRRTVAMLNFTSGLEGMQNACRAVQARLVVTSRAFVERVRLEETIARLEGVRIVYLEDLRAQFGLSDKLWLIGWALRNPLGAVPPGDPSQPAVVMFTSGSEGLPKGVVLSHDSLMANVAQIGAAFPFSSKEKFLSALPLFHAFGITAGVVLPLVRGCRIVLYPSPLHYRMVPEFTYDHDCTVLFSTNTFLSKYARAAHPFDFYSLKYLVVGAEKLSEDVERICFEKFGLRVLEGYGATECAPVIAVNTPLANRRCTVGEILPGIEYRIEPVPGVPEGGVLHVRGDNLMLGYVRPDKPGVLDPPSSRFGAGWYSTGDVVTTDSDFVTIRARLKRFAKVAGEMISLETVERIAAEAVPGAVHAAVAVPDAGRGEAVLLFSEAPVTRELLKLAAHRLGAPEIALPRRIVQLETIPVLGNGKKDYVQLNAMAVEHARSGAPDPASVW